MLNSVYVGNDIILAYPKGPMRRYYYLDGRDLNITPAVIQEDYDQEMLKMFTSRLKPTDYVVDLGANFGLYTLASAWAGVNQISAYEPNPRTTDILRMNVAANRLTDRVSVVEKAISDCSGGNYFWLSDNFPLGNHLVSSGLCDMEETGHYRWVETCILDDDLERCPDVIKMDIEGAELSAWNGMKILKRKNSVLRFVLMDFHGYTMTKQPAQDFIDTILKDGFSIEAYVDPATKIPLSEVVDHPISMLLCER